MPGIQRFYRRLRYGDPIVVVSGLPRSGTSMTMKMLAAGGMRPVADGIRTADEDNPKGYFEDERVKDLHKEIDKSWLRHARGRAIKVISFLLTHLPENNNYKFLFMRRNLQEVLASQAKMLDRRGQESGPSDEQMIQAYENHLWKVNRLLRRRRSFEVLDLPYTSVLEDPHDHAQKIRDFLEMPLEVEKMAAVVDERLYRNRAVG